MVLERETLLHDLYVAYYDARKHKSRRSYVRHWEENLKENMDVLCDDLIHRRYKPQPSKCFIVDYPKKREIFAAGFRDRIVHHLYFNYTHAMFERTFIQDTYSCIRERGTHCGISRMTDFCRRESHNWQRPCYAMNLDIRGYFMHIVRSKLLEIALKSLDKMSAKRISKDSSRKWCDTLDMDFLRWLTEVIITLDPRKDCLIVGEKGDWDGLDPEKSLLKTADGLGLPIGNLTSQLFSNVYLNKLDQFVKRNLKCKYYGRYVSIIDDIRSFLKRELGLDLHMGKLHIREVSQGVEFLGAYIKPWRTYTSRRTLERMERKIKQMDFRRPSKVLLSVNSYLGILQHTKSYKIRRRLFMKSEFLRIGVFDSDMIKYTGREDFYNRKK